MWIKKLRKRKLQSILIVLIVMVCAMLMTSSLVIMSSWEGPYDELSEECDSPALKLHLYNKLSKETADNVANKFERLEEVREAEIIEYSYIREQITVRDKKVNYFMDLTLYNNRLHDRVRVLEGNLNELKVGGCFVPAVVANEVGIAIGDIIKVKEGISYTVQGIYTDPYNMSVSFDTEIIVKEMPQELKSMYLVAVYTTGNVNGTELIDNYREQNDGVLEGSGITLEERITNNQMTEKIMGGILLAMSIMILLVCGVMIRYMVKNTVISETNTIATYKTIGYDNRSIVGIYLKFYLFLVITGSIIGAFGSIVVSDSFTRATFQNIGVSGSKGTFMSGMLCVGGIILFVTLQVYLVLNKTKKIRPIEVYSKEYNRSRKPRRAGSKKINFSPLSMAVRMLQRDRKNTIIILITCIMSAFCVNFAATALTMINGMQESNYYWIGFDKHDVSMEIMNLELQDSVVQELEKMEEVERIIPTTTDVSVSIDWKRGIGDTIMSAMIYGSFEDIDMAVLEGRNPRYNSEIAIGNAFAEKLNKHVGDYIDIYFNGDQKASLLICGTFQSFYNMGKSCRLLGDTLMVNQIDFQYGEASIYLKEGIEADRFAETASVKFAHKAKFMNRSNKYESIMNMIIEPQIKAIGPFMSIVLILGGLNILAIVYLKNKDNSRIFSIYKALGYSSNYLLRVNILYVFLIAAGSIIITVPLFVLAFPRMMVIAMSMMGLKKYIVSYNAAILLISNLLAFFIYLICGIMSSKSLYNNPVEDLTCD
ncbi:MAG TPA: FtsX-like permease family protein [Mobilitalea sp.]|nr:FtsX-like permease family protein [Mobilitalea sp.]